MIAGLSGAHLGTLVSKDPAFSFEVTKSVVVVIIRHWIWQPSAYRQSASKSRKINKNMKNIFRNERTDVCPLGEKWHEYRVVYNLHKEATSPTPNLFYSLISVFRCYALHHLVSHTVSHVGIRHLLINIGFNFSIWNLKQNLKSQAFGRKYGSLCIINVKIWQTRNI